MCKQQPNLAQRDSQFEATNLIHPIEKTVTIQKIINYQQKNLDCFIRMRSTVGTKKSDFHQTADRHFSVHLQSNTNTNNHI